MAHSFQAFAPPQGWQGAWPPPANVAMPPGFPGPPPAPQNASVPRDWQAGFWQFNPNAARSTGTNTGIRAFQGSQQPVAPGAVPWAPSNQWGPQVASQNQQQQSQSFNPYKKVPKPPEAGYYDYKLTQNGLGLEGMEPRKERHHDPDDNSPHTPWIWNPPTLRRESTERPVKARDFPRSRSSMDSDSSRSQSHTRRASADVYGRESYPPSSDAHRRTSQDVPRDTRKSNTNPEWVPFDPAIHAHHRSPPVPPNFVPAGPPPASHRSPTPHRSSAAVPHQPQPTSHRQIKPSESFTERMELHPTFSPQIVRTPDHYHRKNIEATRRKEASSSSSSIYRPASSSSRAYGERSRNATDEAPSSRSREPRAEPLARQSSLPTSLPSSSSSSASSSTFGLPNFTEEPSSLLSPLIGATPKANTGPLARARGDPLLPERSQTLSAIPESSSSSSRRSERSRDTAPLNGLIYEPLQSSRSHRATPHPGRENPLPSPPVDIERSTPSRQDRRPAHYSYKVRKGFWNRRGDHLTPDGYVVYAPEGKTYPTELANYPDGKDGYYNAQTKENRPWFDRPELPSSLPQRGRPPKYPYESFIAYAYI